MAHNSMRSASIFVRILYFAIFLAVMTFPQINTWKNFPANTTLNFSSGGNLELFIDGELEDTCPQAISISPRTNEQRTLSCGYGLYTVVFNVT